MFSPTFVCLSCIVSTPSCRFRFHPCTLQSHTLLVSQNVTRFPPVGQGAPDFSSFLPLPVDTRMPIAIPTLKRKPNEEDDILVQQRNEATLHMARLAYERMKRIDEEDHERGLKEQQYNNSVKYQRMVEYELNNPGETATVRLEQSFSVLSITMRANPHLRLCMTGSTRVRSDLQEVEEETSQAEIDEGSCDERGGRTCTGEFQVLVSKAGAKYAATF